MSACPDQRCDGSGFVFDEAARRAHDCSCRPRRIAKRKARRLSAVIPRRYLGVSFDRPPVRDMERRITDAVRGYVDTLPDQLERGQGIWVQVYVVTGKTTLAMLISAEALRQGHSVAIYSLPRLLGLLRETFDEGSEASLGELLERLTAVELLHLDDVGAEKTSPWVFEQLYSIVNARYEEGRSIVITTNLRDDALREQIGDRTVSRLVEMCPEVVPMFGADRRMDAGFKLPEAPPVSSEPLVYGEPGAAPLGLRRFADLGD